jgi:hypothetical protein
MYCSFHVTPPPPPPLLQVLVESAKTKAKRCAGRGQTFSAIEIRRIDTLILHSLNQPYINYSQYIS